MNIKTLIVLFKLVLLYPRRQLKTYQYGKYIVPIDGIWRIWWSKCQRGLQILWFSALDIISIKFPFIIPLLNSLVFPLPSSIIFPLPLIIYRANILKIKKTHYFSYWSSFTLYKLFIYSHIYTNLNYIYKYNSNF